MRVKRGIADTSKPCGKNIKIYRDVQRSDIFFGCNRDIEESEEIEFDSFAQR